MRKHRVRGNRRPNGLRGGRCWIFILFAIEILAIDFLKLPDIMWLDHYAFGDTGANLTLQYLYHTA